MDLNSKMSPNTGKTKLEVLHFTIPDYRFCIDIAYVKQLVDLVFLQTVPGTPTYFKGLMNFHGQEIPIIDLAIFLNIPTQNQYNLNSKIILCDDGRHDLGLIVDEIVGIETIDVGLVQAQELCQHDFSTFLEGAIITNQEESLVLNIAKIITHVSSKDQNSEKQSSS